MKRIRINNDIRVKVSIARNGLPENFSTLIENGLTLVFRHLSYGNITIVPTYKITGGTIDMIITAEQIAAPGKYLFYIEYKQVNVANPDGYDTITWDSEAFEIVSSTAQVGGTDPVVTYSVDLYAEIGIGLKGSDGASAFEIWLAEPENVDKTLDDYLAWMREPATTAAQQLASFDAQVIDNVNAAIAAIETTNQAVANAETARYNAETLRVAAEQARVTAEEARAVSETSRANAESARDNAEDLRVVAEQARVTAEEARAVSETARANAETARYNAEALRVAAEQARVAAEEARASAEAARANAETSRDNAEDLRVAAEQARVTAEQARATSEAARASAETARYNAESLRVAAETARVNAETVRENYVNGIRTEFNYYRFLNTVFSIDDDMNLAADVPDDSTDEYTINENGELEVTY